MRINPGDNSMCATTRTYLLEANKMHELSAHQAISPFSGAQRERWMASKLKVKSFTNGMFVDSSVLLVRHADGSIILDDGKNHVLIHSSWHHPELIPREIKGKNKIFASVLKKFQAHLSHWLFQIK
jgi:hypothetical protein